MAVNSWSAGRGMGLSRWEFGRSDDENCGSGEDDEGARVGRRIDERTVMTVPTVSDLPFHLGRCHCIVIPEPTDQPR